jgi:hypothetical protein
MNPTSLTEARAYKYNYRHMQREGVAYREGRCVVEVVTYNSGWPSYSQCSRKINPHISPCFCTQHAKRFATQRAMS